MSNNLKILLKWFYSLWKKKYILKQYLTRKRVDMLNLVYCDTQDEQIYSVLSKRMQDTYDIFGSLPDSIETDWIENAEELEKRINIYMHERENARNAFDIRYNDDTNPDANNWEQCTKVLSRKDIVDLLNRAW